MHRITTLLITAAALWAEAAEPENFYSSCEGKSGKELLHALNAVVGPHTNVDYGTFTKLPMCGPTVLCGIYIRPNAGLPISHVAEITP